VDFGSALVGVVGKWMCCSILAEGVIGAVTVLPEVLCLKLSVMVWAGNALVGALSFHKKCTKRKAAAAPIATEMPHCGPP